MAEMNLHGPEVNFAFRIEKVAGSLGVPVMFTEAANARLVLETHLLHTCAVEGFSGSFKFFVPSVK
jgi:class 3 adenylate cyclase